MNHIFDQKPSYLIGKIKFHFKSDEQLKKACQNGNLNLAKISLLLGAHINGPQYENTKYNQYNGYQNQPPITIASHHNHLEIVKLLIEQGADINAVDTIRRYEKKEKPSPRTALRYAMTGDHLEIAKYLVEQGVYLETEYCDFWSAWTPLMHYSMQNDYQMVKFLIDHGANPNTTLWSGNTALLQAIEFDQREMVKLLIEYGADVNFPKDLTPLSRAIFWKNKEMIQILAAAGADLDYEFQKV